MVDPLPYEASILLIGVSKESIEIISEMEKNQVILTHGTRSLLPTDPHKLTLPTVVLVTLPAKTSPAARWHVQRQLCSSLPPHLLRGDLSPHLSLNSHPLAPHGPARFPISGHVLWMAGRATR